MKSFVLEIIPFTFPIKLLSKRKDSVLEPLPSMFSFTLITGAHSIPFSLKSFSK